MSHTMNKASQVTLAFWVMKISATTLGETGEDLLSMTLIWATLLAPSCFSEFSSLLSWHK
jgi:uncharacterized membrane-anchored protein